MVVFFSHGYGRHCWYDVCLMFTFFLSSRSLSFFFLSSSWVASVAVAVAAAAAAAAAAVAAAAVVVASAAVVASLSFSPSSSPSAPLASTLPSIWGLGLCVVLLFGFVTIYVLILLFDTLWLFDMFCLV